MHPKGYKNQIKMRTELELLELLLKVYTEPKFKEFTIFGMCFAVGLLYGNRLISLDEDELFYRILSSGKRGYWFPIGEKEPRIEWIKKQIELWKQKS